MTTSSATSPFYVLVANNADINSADQLGIFLHTGNEDRGGTQGFVAFPANDTSASSFDISPSFSLDYATAIFGSQDASGDGVFILGDLSKSNEITSSPTATFNVGEDQTFTIQTNFGADNFTILPGSDSLPPGFTLDASTGVLTGEAASSGTFNLTIRATNLRSLVELDQNLTLSLVGGLSIVDTLPVQAVRGKAFSYTITANQIADSFGATIPANASWLTRNGAVLSGTPPAGQTAVNVDISATKGGTTKDKTLRINFRNPTLSGSGNITKRLGEDVSYSITPEAGVTGVFSATGLPYGLSINPSTGTISGSAVAADGTADTSDCGDKPIIVKLSDSNGNELTTFSFVITLLTKLPEISSVGPIVGSALNPLSYPITVSSTEATVSSGLSISAIEDAGYQIFKDIGLSFADGIISGAPLRTAQPFKIKLRANNSSSLAPGAGFGNEVEIEIDIDNPLPAHSSENRQKIYTSVGVPFSYSYDSANNATEVMLSGSLPPGISSSLGQAGTSAQVTLQGSCTKAGEYPLAFSPRNTTRNGVFQTPANGPMPLTIVVLPAATRPAVGSGASGTFRYRAGQPIAHYISGNPAPSGLFFNVTGLPSGLFLERAKTVNTKNVASGTFQTGDILTNDGNSSGSAGGGQFDAGLIWGTVDASKRGTYPLTVYVATRAGTTKTTLTLVIE